MPERPEWHQIDLIDAMEEAVCLLSVDQEVLFTNDRMGELLGVPASTLCGRKFTSFFVERGGEELSRAFAEAEAEGRARLNMALLAGSASEPIPVLLRLVRYNDPSARNEGLYAILLDLTELSNAIKAQETLLERNRVLEELAITCPLTGIYNRRYFDYRYGEEMDRARRYHHGLAVALLDLDHFKSINDLHGHPVGDQVLRSVAQLIRNTMRASDIAARYGGEEFGVVMPESTPQAALAVGLRLRMAIQARKVKTDKGELSITASIGICCVYPPDKVPEDDLILKRADEALYKAKESGRNRVVLWGHPID
jgi:diguanylate cyclase (GGDEF)-like protein